jgi:L-ascorbate metabolism protein UlaG (beta-lactamase superfamily)
MSVRTVFGGVANLLVSDGSDALLVDGYFSRPTLLRLLGRVRPDPERIAGALGSMGVERLTAVLVSHSHVDHVLDAPVIADRTGAVLAGSASTRQVQVGYGLADRPFLEFAPGEPVAFGAFTVTPVLGRHSPGDRAPGRIAAPLELPARSREFRTGETYSFHIDHPDGAVLVHGSANFVPRALDAYEADVASLGVGAAGRATEEWRAEYWRQTVVATGSRRVRPVHWDAFWRPLERGLEPLPRAFDRLDATMATFERLAAADGVDLRLPSLWEELVIDERPAPAVG